MAGSPFASFDRVRLQSLTLHRTVYLSSFCILALTARAITIRRRIASEREGLSFCRLAQLSMSDLSAGGSRNCQHGILPRAGDHVFFVLRELTSSPIICIT